ncbi:hypothetical protein R3P38DRAFT_286474 [Favolaschia claudopus]|uniref:Uncharacterized protein n=1 Tax=Favolaschia claudopus TaxID=2862362 RepID=A0AAV9ZNA5_9AGAR
MFSRASNFTVSGGNFTTAITKQYISPIFSDFRRIPLGDIDLLREVCLDDDAVLRKRQGRHRHSVRKIYSARIDGRDSNATVAVYQGVVAQEEWRHDLSKYHLVRHPSLIQVWGIARLGNIYATVFHDDLMPLRQFLSIFRELPTLTVYIYSYTFSDFTGALTYFEDVCNQALLPNQCTLFIRGSTGQLCVDLVPDKQFHWVACVNEPSEDARIQLLNAGHGSSDQEISIMKFLSLEVYHEISQCDLAQHSFEAISPSTIVDLDAVVLLHHSGSSRFEDSVKIAFLRQIDAEELDTLYWRLNEEMVGGEGWSCLPLQSIVGATISLELRASNARSWLSQANHIFARLGISTNLEDYVIPATVEFSLTIMKADVTNAPSAYLLLCPVEDFEIRPASVRWPDCPAYWSLDSSGAQRLTLEDAEKLGLPSFALSAAVITKSWETNVYAALRRFHEAKGFDPDSQEIASKLGHPLYCIGDDGKNISAAQW